MYYALTVNLPQWPPELGRLWLEALRPHGLVVEPTASCDPTAHPGGRLAVRLPRAPGSCPAAGRYGDSPILAGFEASFQRLRRADHALLSKEYPAHVWAVEWQSPYEAHLSTDRGRTVANVRLRCFAAAVGYDRGMIKNPQAYARQSEQDRWDALRGMSAAESIAIGEALLTSDVMRLAEFPDDDHPLSLVIALGLSPTAAAGSVVPDDAGE